MPGMRDPLSVYTVAETLRQCAHNELEHTTQGLPDRSCVVWGDIAWDNCECGQLVVSIGRRYPSANFPTEGPFGNIRPSKCGHPLIVVTYAISILRCAPSGGDNGEPPSCEDLSTAAVWATEDAWTVRNATLCCLRSLKEQNQIVDWTLLDQTAEGPDGLCMGSQQNLLVGFNNGCVPCDETS